MAKIKISPDGTLPRITSSSIGITRHLQIVKVPDDEVKEGGLLYKLIHITANESESEPEKSEEEPWSDDDISNVAENMTSNQLSLGAKEKAKDVESQTEAHARRDEHEGVHSVRRYKDNRNKRFRGSSKGNFKFPKKKFNTPNRSRKKYDNSNTNLSNVEEKNYKYFSNNNEFGSNNFVRYNTPRNIDSIEVWSEPMKMIINGVPTFPCSQFPYAPAPVVKQTPPNKNADNSLKKSVGLLGDSPFSTARPHDFPSNIQNDDPPYSASHPRDFPSNRQNDEPSYSAPHPHDFPSNRQNDKSSYPAPHPHDFPSSRQNDKSSYPAPHPHDFPSSRQNDDFFGEQEYWTNEYQGYPPNNYQRRPNRGIPGRGRGRGRGLISVPSSQYRRNWQSNSWKKRTKNRGRYEKNFFRK